MFGRDISPSLKEIYCVSVSNSRVLVQAGVPAFLKVIFDGIFLPPDNSLIQVLRQINKC